MQTNRLTRWQRLVLFGFERLYNELAWTYDVVSWAASLGQWRDWQRAGLPFLRGSRILELAHGPGHMLLAMWQAGYEVVGFDLSADMGRLAQKRLNKQLQSDSHQAAPRTQPPIHRSPLPPATRATVVPLVRGRAQQLPFAAGSFESILATFPASFVVEADTIAGLFRVLRPGGRLVIVPEARLTGRGPLRHFLEWLYAVTGQRQGPAGTGGPSGTWLMAGQRFEAAGFRIAIEQVSLPGSVVTVVVASRPAAASGSKE